MLKIKDNVDLKELEKFGLKYNGGSEVYVDDYDYSVLCIYENNKEILLDTCTIGFNQFSKEKQVNDNAINILYDLIKVDLVEKVEEE